MVKFPVDRFGTPGCNEEEEGRSLEVEYIKLNMPHHWTIIAGHSGDIDPVHCALHNRVDFEHAAVAAIGRQWHAAR